MAGYGYLDYESDLHDLEEDKMKDDKILRIETEVARTAVKAFVEKLREWCESNILTRKYGAKSMIAMLDAFDLLAYAESLLEEYKEQGE